MKKIEQLFKLSVEPPVAPVRMLRACGRRKEKKTMWEGEAPDPDMHNSETFCLRRGSGGGAGTRTIKSVGLAGIKMWFKALNTRYIKKLSAARSVDRDTKA